MITALAIIGAIHVIAYALGGFAFASTLFIDWFVRHFRLKADMLRAYKRMLDERQALNQGTDNVG